MMLLSMLFVPFQQSDHTMQESKSVMARVLSSSHTVIMNGLTRLSSSTKSVAKLLQPQLAKKLAELNKISHRLLTQVNAPKQPLYKMKVGHEFNCPVSYVFLKIFLQQWS